MSEHCEIKTAEDAKYAEEISGFSIWTHKVKTRTRHHKFQSYQLISFVPAVSFVVISRVGVVCER